MKNLGECISYTDDLNYTVYDKTIDELGTRFNIAKDSEIEEVLAIMKRNNLEDNGIEFINIYDHFVAKELTEEQVHKMDM
ncbi:hypothetical protein TP70_03675 [Staphylococcus microti]|uniref:Uncharacterized protein n=1 Tax=Staphylococcus microti TaxID=569857 RepID=A0A0D6XQX8_9STAP|nr:hypothetical protein [Staphylococcus microti]KIX91214.1 hypothetical protein TP70_03675 [Staphylococcus microti]PNZ79919.1 hypothetical protein CD132_09035 [Staphylococcus microti]SUM56465.1 Uncharacterised protein [Staphylococcus microti]